MVEIVHEADVPFQPVVRDTLLDRLADAASVCPAMPQTHQADVGPALHECGQPVDHRQRIEERAHAHVGEHHVRNCAEEGIIGGGSRPACTPCTAC